MLFHKYNYSTADHTRPADVELIFLVKRAAILENHMPINKEIIRWVNTEDFHYPAMYEALVLAINSSNVMVIEILYKSLPYKGYREKILVEAINEADYELLKVFFKHEFNFTNRRIVADSLEGFFRQTLFHAITTSPNAKTIFELLNNIPNKDDRAYMKWELDRFQQPIEENEMVLPDLM